MEQYKIILNGTEKEFLAEKNTMLIHVLRDILGITSVKPGCLTGDCGACKVIVDGSAKNSCTIPIQKVMGASIVTVEGIGSAVELHPLQTAFHEKGALQCGYCTPGFIMSSYALLENNLNPTKDEIVEAIDNNICRCTGYKKIVEAIQFAAEIMRGEVYEG